jgi:hypothetical protein
MHEVPLVHHHHDGLVLLHRLTRDRLVLLRDPVECIEDEENDVRVLDRIERAQAREVLDRRGQLGLGPDARGIDQAERMLLSITPLELKRNLHRVARRSGRGTHDETIAFEQAIAQGGLPDVRSSDETHAKRVGRRLFAGLITLGRTQPAQDLVSQLSLSATVLRRHVHGFAKSEPMHLARFNLLLTKIRLVDDQNDVLARPTQARRDRLIQRRDPFQAVQHEDDHIRGFDREVHLLFGGTDQLTRRFAALQPQSHRCRAR